MFYVSIIPIVYPLITDVTRLPFPPLAIVMASRTQLETAGYRCGMHQLDRTERTPAYQTVISRPCERFELLGLLKGYSRNKCMGHFFTPPSPTIKKS